MSLVTLKWVEKMSEKTKPVLMMKESGIGNHRTHRGEGGQRALKEWLGELRDLVRLGVVP